MASPPATLDPNGIALFLDVDGTLLDIRDNPAEVVADESLTELLGACYEQLGGALSLVSGRSIADVDRIFAPAVFPIAGAHGAELRFGAGRTTKLANQPLPVAIRDTLEAFAARHDGLLLEFKRGGASLHFRKAPALQDECRRFAVKLLAELGEAYRLIAGKMVFEIAPAAHHKGEAISLFLDEAPFCGRSPVFIGDDVTDEDGFLVVNRLAGLSVRVGDTGCTAASCSLQSVAEVRRWLRHAILGSQFGDQAT